MNKPDEKPVASPCIGVCALDEGDICEGCFRSADEITDWCALDRESKREVLGRCAERRAASGLVL